MALLALTSRPQSGARHTVEDTAPAAVRGIGETS